MDKMDGKVVVMVDVILLVVLEVENLARTLVITAVQTEVMEVGIMAALDKDVQLVHLENPLVLFMLGVAGAAQLHSMSRKLKEGMVAPV